LDVTEKNYADLVASGKVGTLNEDDNDLVQETAIASYEAAMTALGNKELYEWTGEYEKVPENNKITSNNYSKYLGYLYDENHNLITDNGFNETYDYYYETYVPVDVSSEDSGNKIVYYKTNNGWKSVTSTSYSANTQYYQKIYKYIVLSKENYKSNKFFYLT